MKNKRYSKVLGKYSSTNMVHCLMMLRHIFTFYIIYEMCKMSLQIWIYTTAIVTYGKRSQKQNLIKNKENI